MATAPGTYRKNVAVAKPMRQVVIGRLSDVLRMTTMNEHARKPPCVPDGAQSLLCILCADRRIRRRFDTRTCWPPHCVALSWCADISIHTARRLCSHTPQTRSPHAGHAAQASYTHDARRLIEKTEVSVWRHRLVWWKTNPPLLDGTARPWLRRKEKRAIPSVGR